MKDKFNQFMTGRYGVDELSKVMMGVAVGVMILNLFVRLQILNIVVVALIVLIYLRMFSKNIRKRYEENCRYYAIKQKMLGFFGKQKRTAADLKKNHIYTCPGCGQKIRIPRGRGRIIVTCPKCRHEFEKKS